MDEIHPVAERMNVSMDEIHAVAEPMHVPEAGDILESDSIAAVAASVHPGSGGSNYIPGAERADIHAGARIVKLMLKRRN